MATRSMPIVLWSLIIRAISIFVPTPSVAPTRIGFLILNQEQIDLKTTNIDFLRFLSLRIIFLISDTNLFPLFMLTPELEYDSFFI